MKPQDQTIFSDNCRGLHGDCMRACIATLLDLSIKEVPHFAEVARVQAKRQGPGDFWGTVHKWLDSKGLAMIQTTSNMADKRVGVSFYNLDCYHLMNGPSPRNPAIWHSVVAYKGRMVHDPHPSRAGLLPVSADYPYRYYDFIVPKGITHTILSGDPYVAQAPATEY